MFTQIPTFSSYSVNDIQAAKSFYTDTLGLQVVQTKEGLDITLAKGAKLFLYEKQDHAPATFTVLNFIVENIDQAVDKLLATGIQLERYNQGEMRADAKGIYRGIASGHGPDIAWFKDPAGNVLSVVQSD
jgi:catechol 2,3-dioxygenase-like lactoylglutathione lyase family enzyme